MTDSSRDPALHTLLYRDGALADGHGNRLRLGVSILVADGRSAWIHRDPLSDPVALWRAWHVSWAI